MAIKLDNIHLGHINPKNCFLQPRVIFSSPNHGWGLQTHSFCANNINSAHVPNQRPCSWPLIMRNICLGNKSPFLTPPAIV
jgi:hypothetical protein